MSAKHNILHIIKSLGRGGAEMLLPETLKLHDQSTFYFHYIYFLPWKDQMVDSLIAAGGKVVCLNAKNNLQLMFKINEVVQYIKKNKIELIHAHLPWAGIVARIAGKLSGVPVIYTEHNKQERYHLLTRMMNLATMNWLTQLVAVSEDVERSIRKHKIRLRPNLKVILNGVNTEHFVVGRGAGYSIRKAFNIDEKTLIVGTIAVFRFQKRLELWMEIAKKISSRMPDTHFIIVGDGRLKALLIEKRAQLGMEKTIHFAGMQTEVRPYLASFDLYLMSSVFEGLPLALLEAMACGCPVVSTDAGGIKEVVRHNVDGLLCDVDKPEFLSDMAIAMLESKEKRQQMGTEARQRIAESFSLGKMVKELETLYFEILPKRAVDVK